MTTTPSASNLTSKPACYAHCHMTAAEYGFLDVCRSVSHASGVLYFDGRNMAARFGTMAASTAYELVDRLTKKGWLILVKPSERLSSGRFSERHYRVLSHEEWVKYHPNECRQPVQIPVPDANPPVRIPDSPVRISNKPVRNPVHNLVPTLSSKQPLESNGEPFHLMDGFIERFSKGGKRRQRNSAKAQLPVAQPVLDSGQGASGTVADPQTEAGRATAAIAGSLGIRHELLIADWRGAVDRLVARGHDSSEIMEVASYYITRFGQSQVLKERANGFEQSFDWLQKELTKKQLAELTERTAPEGKTA